VLPDGRLASGADDHTAGRDHNETECPARALLAPGIEVRAMVRPVARLEALGWPSSTEVFRADLRTSRELGRAFEGVDVVLHLAAVVSGGEDAQFAGTVAGTERLLGAIAAYENLLNTRPGGGVDRAPLRRQLHPLGPGQAVGAARPGISQAHNAAAQA